MTEARRWLDDAPAGLRVIDVSQAAPAEPPPEPLRREIARVALEEADAHLYGPVLGLPALRARLAAEWTAAYGASVAAADVAVTSGCNQAFATAVSILAAPGDEVILPVPWYFNHAMWLSQQGLRAVPLPTGEALIPDPDAAARLIGPRTRAIALVTPNNPTGREYPAEILAAFLDLCRARGIALILDETYRDFHSAGGAPHDLLARDWRGTLVQLYSFSKAYRLTGHRVGAMVADAAFLAQAEKVLDTVTICPNGIGQRAALWGMENLGAWLAGERAEVLARRDAVLSALGSLPGWRALSAGAYFAYAGHPWDAPSAAVARALVRQRGVLALPGAMFHPGGDPAGDRTVRIAFANLDRPGIALLAERLAGDLEGLSPRG
ncbi:aspartate/methionine/tyrosine aminotransferase [Hasllibacter halocynthiae]|uniref:aspartate transaminase n=1 Tax=Hasllibacter halocynthiae TaxID=595589 RepID=A0A2T0X812_9RHOB|nr:aspartate/methionine/tyrosine aminotransferase [Hasllibacter halocynthiae]